MMKFINFLDNQKEFSWSNGHQQHLDESREPNYEIGLVNCLVSRWFQTETNGILL